MDEDIKYLQDQDRDHGKKGDEIDHIQKAVLLNLNQIPHQENPLQEKDLVNITLKRKQIIEEIIHLLQEHEVEIEMVIQDIEKSITTTIIGLIKENFQEEKHIVAYQEAIQIIEENREIGENIKIVLITKMVKKDQERGLLWKNDCIF